ncbi:MAG: hypothetical protein GF313_01500 [Caldithrix sp.]|nr:hypothetical protein [Caldithrix sp.]
MRRMYRFAGLLSIVALLWACSENADVVSFNKGTEEASETNRFGGDRATSALSATFEIKLDNMAPATGPGASQPMSPIVVAVHKPGFHMFRLGELASDELRQIAEDAVSTPMLELLSKADKVHDFGQGNGVILPGKSDAITLEGTTIAHRLSIVSMLVNTNDGIVGFDGVPLPREGSKMVYLRALDAGTEENTEMKAHIPGPCCGNPLVRVPTEEPIFFHSGIQGDGDLDPDVYGWDEPVAKLTITRIN